MVLVVTYQVSGWFIIQFLYMEDESIEPNDLSVCFKIYLLWIDLLVLKPFCSLRSSASLGPGLCSTWTSCLVPSPSPGSGSSSALQVPPDSFPQQLPWVWRGAQWSPARWEGHEPSWLGDPGASPAPHSAPRALVRTETDPGKLSSHTWLLHLFLIANPNEGHFNYLMPLNLDFTKYS